MVPRISLYWVTPVPVSKELNTCLWEELTVWHWPCDVIDQECPCCAPVVRPCDGPERLLPSLQEETDAPELWNIIFDECYIEQFNSNNFTC